MSDEGNGKVLGAAIFGAGWVAGEHARAYQKCERTRLVAVGSRKAESARKCAEYAGAADAFITTDFDALLKRPDVDLVSITTPPDLHPELTIRAARAGKHVCIEKPVALDWKSCLEMQKAVKQAGVKTIVSFCLHWNPSLVNTRSADRPGRDRQAVLRRGGLLARDEEVVPAVSLVGEKAAGRLVAAVGGVPRGGRDALVRGGPRATRWSKCSPTTCRTRATTPTGATTRRRC